MMLSEIKRRFTQEKRTTLDVLALHFNTSPDAMRGMLEHWVQKGKVRKDVVQGSCNGCSECRCEGLEIYEWVS